VAKRNVEHIHPPSSPLHLLVPQIMGLSLQEGGIGAADWRRWIDEMPGFARCQTPTSP
jgi:hypothetical protein